MKRYLSMLLVMTLLIGCSAFNPVTAVEPDVTKTEAVKAEAAVPDAATPEGQSTTVQHLQADLVKQLDAKGIFQHIDETAFRKAGHTYRLPEEEDLNTYVFRNQDGTKSIYYMQENVKYKAADGSIRDKDIRLVRQTDGYSIRENMVDLWIPDSVEDGIRVDYGKQSIRLLPLGGSGAARQQDNSVVYADFYGPGMDLKYTPTLSGLKEDIVLEAYTGVNSFSFLLETGGLHLCEAGGKYYLATSQTARATFYLGDIIVFDAIGRPSKGTMTVETVTPGEAYRLTISADVGFLTDPATVYPVTIDPTVTVTDKTSESMIEDSPVFSKYPNNNHGYGAFLYNSIGYTNATLGTGRTVFRFNGLLADPKFNSLDPENITSVEFFVRDAGTNGNYQVNIHAIQNNTTWTESTVTWNSVSDYCRFASASQTMGYSYWSTFDITTLARGWKTGLFNGQCGLIMIANNESQYIVTCSTDYTYDTLWPYVVMTYEDDFYLNHSVMDVDEGSGFILTAIVNSSPNASVTWRSSNSSIASVNASGYVTGHLAGMATITATYTDADGEAHEESCDVYVTVADGLYYIKNAYSGLCMQAVANTVTVRNKVTNQESRVNQLWKIEHIANGRYSIQPMQDLSLALARNATNVINLNSDEFASNWGIIHNNFGYAIQYGGNASECARPVAANIPGSQVQLDTWQSSSACHWALEKAYGIFLRDVATERTVNSDTVFSLDLGREYALSDLGLCYEYYGSMVGGMSWFLNNSGIATIDYEGAVMPSYGGTGVVTVSATLNGFTYTASYSVAIFFPLSGYELEYEPELWNDVYVDETHLVRHYTNCYAYILNNQIDPDGTNYGCNSTYDPIWGTHKQQPGEFYNAHCGTSPQVTWSTDDPQSIIEAVKKDFEAYNAVFGTSLQFYEISDLYAPCPAGSYRVVLVVGAGYDYHWYRQDSDGCWSHKQGESEVERIDEQEEIIWDPRTADHGNYSTYIGFFVVTPWNNMYSQPANLTSMSNYALAFAPTRNPYVPESIAKRVSLGMRIEEVIKLIGHEGVDIGNGTVIHQYQVEQNQALSIVYEMDEYGILRVSQVMEGIV